MFKGIDVTQDQNARHHASGQAILSHEDVAVLLEVLLLLKCQSISFDEVAAHIRRWAGPVLATHPTERVESRRDATLCRTQRPTSIQNLTGQLLEAILNLLHQPLFGSLIPGAFCAEHHV